MVEQTLAEGEITCEQIETELESDGDISKDYYVQVELEIIPEENPCVIMYVFTAHLTGNYEFAVSELFLWSPDAVVNKRPDVTFEFRIYGTEEAHSVSDVEEIEFSPRDIVAIQRILLYSATKFNENGLPREFRSYEYDV